MNAEQLLAHYEKIADAPDAVEKLRQFILELAICGKLTSQDPQDEPASELLKRISVERQRLAVTGEFQEPRSFARIDRDALPFSIPVHWEWARLIDIARPNYGFAFASSRFNTSKRGMPLIRIRDISASDTEAYFDGEYDPGYIVRAGDYLVGMDGDFNLRRWGGKDALLNQRVMRISKWRCGVDPEFVRLPLQIILDFLHGVTSQTTVKHLSAKQVNGIEIPLPPVEEQRRIVAKVDELMALCDQLEAARTEREATRDRLAAASLARLNAPDPDTFTADARFALDALQSFTVRADQIKQLRQTILALAVCAKLVEQDPADEPASELLKRVGAKKSKMAAAGAIKSRKINARERREPLDWRLPENWVLTDLGAISLKITDGAHKTPTYVQKGVPFVSVKDFSAGQLDLSSTRFIPKSEHEVLYRRCDPRRGDMLLGRIGTIGKAVLVDTDVEFSLFVSVGLIRFDHHCLVPEFFRLLLNSPFVEKEFDRIKIGGGTHTNKLNLGDLHTVAVPLPPFAEQKRIVAKVGVLMTLCDQLEASLARADDTRRRLLDALLAEALQPALQAAA